MIFAATGDALGGGRMPDAVWLFSYGTLRQPEVQRAVFGREVQTVDDRLVGFRLDMLTIADRVVIETSGSDRHPILKRGLAESTVDGVALLLTDTEIEQADRYEVAEYSRVPVVLASGRQAYVYMEHEE